ncbi:MAG TPA: hypothetical protein VFR02_09825, partial [bacterium]|nr:hypothetical protein [bacterium]
WHDAVLAVFKRRQTGFLTTDSLLKEMHFRKAIQPKEDKERLEGVLLQMQEAGLIAFNQFKLASLTDQGKAAVEAMTPERLAEIEKADRERAQ